MNDIYSDLCALYWEIVPAKGFYIIIHNSSLIFSFIRCILILQVNSKVHIMKAHVMVY